MGQVYTTSLGNNVILETRLGVGGEGEVWTVQGSLEVAKIYHPHIVKPEHEQKLRAMVANPPLDEMRVKGHVSIAWPTEMLFQGKTFAGFLMPRLEKSPTIFTIYHPLKRQKECPGFNWFYLFHTASNLSKAIEAIHYKGYVIGDLNESNILVKPTALVSVIDTDSFQVTDTRGRVYRCRVGKEEFSPPELIGKPLDQINRKPEHDNFGLGVLIFRLLMEGFYPFAGVLNITSNSSEPDQFYCLKVGAFPYVRNPIVKPPPLAPPFEMLPPEVQKLMVRCFVAGYKNPASRPSPGEWVGVLESCSKSLVNCKINREHFYSKHYGKCPWCEREAKKQKVRLQTPLPPARVRPSSSSRPAYTPPPPVISPVFPQSSPRVAFRLRVLNKLRPELLWQRTKRFFRSPGGYLDRHIWWSGMRRHLFLGAGGGIGLFFVFILMQMYPAIAGWATGAITAGLIATPTYLIVRKFLRLQNNRDRGIGIGVIFLGGALAILSGIQVRSWAIVILESLRLQMIWAFVDSGLVGMVGGAAFGNYRVLSKYKSQALTIFTSLALAAIPLLLMGGIGLLSFAFDAEGQVWEGGSTQTTSNGSTGLSYMACAEAIMPSRLQVGERAILSSGMRNNLRSEAGTQGGTSTILGEILGGDEVEILNGPGCTENLVWWQVKVIRTDQIGWTAEFGIAGEKPPEYWLIPKP